MCSGSFYYVDYEKNQKNVPPRSLCIESFIVPPFRMCFLEMGI